MKITGEQEIDAEPSVVWAALNNEGILKLCVPGCEELNQGDDGSFDLRIVLRLGPIKARFSGQARLERVVVNESCRIVGEGSGGVAGQASGHADVLLRRTENGTSLTYSSAVVPKGRIAQLGGRVLEAAAASLTERFFRAFREQLSELARV